MQKSIIVYFVAVVLIVIFYFFQQHVSTIIVGDGIKGPKGMVWVPGGDSHKVHVDGFWMDQTDVTNDQFEAFVKATGYVTTAEQKSVSGACWHHPQGPQSNIIGKGDYPVVQVSSQDVLTYAKWIGKRLPTDAEWELAVSAKQVNHEGRIGSRLVETKQMFDATR